MLQKLLMEGRYDKITTKVTRDSMNVIKDITKKTSREQPKYRGKTVYIASTGHARKKPQLSPGKEVFSKTYNDRVSDIEFEYYFYVFRDEALPVPVAVDGFVVDDDIHIAALINPEHERRAYSKLVGELKLTLRHEIEHLTQRGYNVKPGKRRNYNWQARGMINAFAEWGYKYYYLADETDANLQGLYKLAKYEKRPFPDVARDYLDDLINQGIMNKKQSDIVYSKWKARAKKIGGLPPL